MVNDNYTALGLCVLKDIVNTNPNLVIIDSVVTNCKFYGEGSIVIVDSELDGCVFGNGNPITVSKSIIRDSIIEFYASVYRSTIIRLEKWRKCEIFISENARILPLEKERFFPDTSVILRNNVYYEVPESITSSWGDIITDAPNDEITVNCITNKYQKWLGKAGRKYGRMNGYTEEHMNEIEQLIKQVKKLN